MSVESVSVGCNSGLHRQLQCFGQNRQISIADPRMADQDAIQLSPSLLNSPLLLSLTHSPFIISLTPPSPLQSYTLEEIRVKCWSAIITMAV